MTTAAVTVVKPAIVDSDASSTGNNRDTDHESHEYT